MVPLIRRLAFALSILLTSFASAADVELKASWTKGPEHWLVHIQVDRAGFSIASNSPAFENERLIQVTDAVTHQPVPFRLRHLKQRMARAIDLAFPQLQRPMSVSVNLAGIVVVDQNGRRAGYQQSLTVRAPVTSDRPIVQPSSSPLNPHNWRTAAAPPVSPRPSVAASVAPLVGGGAPPEDLGGGLEVGEGAPAPEPEIPQFPFPPPQASASDEIPRELLVAEKTGPKLKDVDAVLSRAFAKCGYGEKSFYAVPDGFAMASRLEQINDDGSFNANRWSLQTAAMKSFSIESYLHALFQTRAGHFRVVVFVVTNHPFQQTDVKVNSDEAKSWVRKGLNQLPKKIGDRDFTDDYTCTVLVYEFKSLGGGEAKFVEPSEITGHTHLEKSGLLGALSRTR
ncbi:MAG TPA: hypothetical protein VH170_01130 [Chthoniobacterales bacterium]|nr:hypothetical protein [Chthoniobacterales bacterium]